ncbi:hypothetical protein BGLA2_1050028 [Burkholderia gladioli]|nr:hypothetical protein BGLA2_1050028 [Burkholderia gladioli]
MAQALGAHLASISRGRSPSPEAVFSSDFLHLNNMRFGIFRGSHPPRKTRRQFEYPDISAYVKKSCNPKTNSVIFPIMKRIVNGKSRKTPAVHTDSIHVVRPIRVRKSGSATLPGAPSKNARESRPERL